MGKIGKNTGGFSRPKLPSNAVQCQLVDQEQGYTPAQMRELYAQGLAVGAQNAGVYTETASNPSWEIPVEEKRGVDPAELWELQVLTRRKVRDCYRADKEKFGN